MTEAAVVDAKNFVQDCYEIGDADNRGLLKSSDLAIREIFPHADDPSCML